MTDGAARLEGRRILITGAASGIGLAAAQLFAAHGAKLGLLDMNAEALERTAKPLSAEWRALDLTHTENVQPAVAQLAEGLGGLDGVINCAGVQVSSLLADLEPADWEKVMAINLTAPYAVCRAALPWLKASGRATIVNVASGQALLPSSPGVSAYAASKAGLTGFTKAIAHELAPTVRANVLCPGITATPLVQSVLDGYSNPDDAPFVQQYALKRVAQPVEMAEALLFLTSEASSYVTGVVLAADGGRTFH